MQFYRSKIDAWLLGVIALVIGFSVYAALRSDHLTLLSGLALTIAVVLPLWLLLNTRYGLDTSLLSVRCGPFHSRIPIADIQSITPTRNPLSSPALSLDRLRIEYGHNRHVLISPRDRERFTRDLQALKERAIQA